MDFETRLYEYFLVKLDAVMPWVGLYIAAASAVCTLAMAADAFNGFRLKRYWFPCKYFSLNAASLTLLAVAMKLPMDLTTVMIGKKANFLAKFSSLIFMSTAMANFMSSLGSMNNKNILANVVALGILVFTIVGNVWIQLFQLWRGLSLIQIMENLVPTILMLLLLGTLVSLAVMAPTTKRNLESKYQEKHKAALREEEALRRREAFRIENKKGEMMKYWVMAETSSPQFVMARSVVSTTSAVICLLAAIILAGTYFLVSFLSVGPESFEMDAPVYGWSTILIHVIQSIGVVVGIIAPTLRWLVAVCFKCSTRKHNSFKKEFKIDAYWIQTLVDWRDSSSASQIRQNKYRKCLHDAKWFAATFCIGVQILIVLVSKLLVFLSALLIRPLFRCFTHINKFLMQCSSTVMTSSNGIGNELGDNTYLNLRRYVLLLEGEAELPRRVLKDICLRADDMIQRGRKKQPENLVDLLRKFVNFNGVEQFDSNQIPSLHDSQEPPNCWALPVVTLTSIAIALPNIAEHKVKKLVGSVSEGLSLAKTVETALDKNAQLLNIRKAADVCWVRVVHYMKWLDTNLRETSLVCKNSKEVLQALSDKAEGIIDEFKKEEKDSLMENPLYWPAKIVAANSMYRISRTILLSCDEGENENTDEGLFERLSVMIADILAACLTNLPHAITTMCHRNTIEKREESLRKAFFLLGKTEQVVELLRQKEWPSLDHDKAAYIEEWRAWFWQNQDDSAALTSTSSDEIVATTPVSSEEYLALTESAILFGIVLRDDRGNFVACRSSVMNAYYEVKEGEAVGLLEALSWIRDMGYKRVIFELDAKSVVDAMHNTKEDESEFGSIIRDCQLILYQEPSFSVSFISRLANALAYKLAKDACSVYSPNIWFYPPSSIGAMLFADCNSCS